MTLKQLEYFRAVADTGNVSAASRLLHVAQPPISRQIATLEEELGVQLFLRGNRGMTLTEAGESLNRQSQELILGLDRMVETIRSIDSGISGTLKIGIIYSTMPYAMPYIQEFHEIYSQVELYIRLGSPQDLIIDLNRGNLQALFLRSASKDASGLNEKIVGEDSLMIITTRELDPAPDLDAIPIEKLAGVPLCLLRGDDIWSYNEYLLNECQRNGFTPNIVCQCYDTPMAMQMVQSGFGISFLPSSIVKTHPHSGIYAKPVVGLPVMSYAVLAWKEEQYQSKCTQLFTRYGNSVLE